MLGRSGVARAVLAWAAWGGWMAVAQVSVRITPVRQTVAEGRGFPLLAQVTGLDGVDPAQASADCVWTVLDEQGQPVPDRPDAGLRDPGTVPGGRTFIAPPGSAGQTFRVRVRCRAAAWAEATLLVLPFRPFGVPTVDRILADLGVAGDGDHWSADRPFVDLATGRRFRGLPPPRLPPPPPRDGWRRAWDGYVTTLGRALARPFPAPPGVHPSGPSPCVHPRVDAGLAGYGLPFRLAWAPPAWAERQLLSVQEEGGVRRREVTGQATASVRLRQADSVISVEALGPDPGTQVRSCYRTFSVQVRGLLPLAGNPAALPDLRDGQGLRARFRAPCGIVRVGWAPYDPDPRPGRPRSCRKLGKWLVADPEQHVLQLVYADGEVKTLWGWAGQAGFQDGEPGQVRFHGPTFVAVEPVRNLSVVVADSGNHLVRLVKPSGQVLTLAGNQGVPGHQDGSQSAALFNDPRGLAVDGLMNVFVADRGNHVIRRIARDGMVTTLAGGPGLPGSVDGTGAEARFWDLQGLALDHQDNLYVVDGHSVRRITRTGRVTTLLGDPARGGFQDSPAGAGPHRLAGLPCLDRPVGLAVIGDHLFIADLGNQAIRDYHLATGALATLAGEPQATPAPVLRWGLLRDRIPGPLDERYAALDQPRGLGWDPADPKGRLAVTTGQCVALITRPLTEPQPPPRIQGRAEAGAGEPYTAVITPVTWAPSPPDPLPSEQPVQATVEFLDPDGTVIQRSQGAWPWGASFPVTGTFTEAGAGAVRCRTVTGEGISLWAEQTVVVHPVRPVPPTAAATGP